MTINLLIDTHLSMNPKFMSLHQNWRRTLGIHNIRQECYIENGKNECIVRFKSNAIILRFKNVCLFSKRWLSPDSWKAFHKAGASYRMENRKTIFPEKTQEIKQV